MFIEGGAMRASGILLPSASLPGEYGIGSFSKHAYQFIDQLKEAGQKYWQILPIGPTGYGDSPYQSFSTFAGNPYFIDLDMLCDEGLLNKYNLVSMEWYESEEKISYERLWELRYEVLREAFLKSRHYDKDSYKIFLEENRSWLDDYALFMSCKGHFENKEWLQWHDDIKNREKEAVKRYSKYLEQDINFWKFVQYKFYEQWTALKDYANEKEISIIGDIPIYVAYDSADLWANRELFQLKENGEFKAVAGCPPDGFSATGQLWGNPLYNWEYHKKTEYAWWISRIRFCFQIYDVVRVDHFRGFDEYYAIPYGAMDASNGKWEQGPGIDHRINVD